MFKKLSNYFYAIINLKPKQIIFRLYYSIKKRNKLDAATLSPKKAYPLVMVDSIASYKSYMGENSFLFLNRSYHFQEKIDWNYAGYGMLWAYNLNYFEFLCQGGLDKETGLRLIADYIDQRKNIRVGYDSYPVSLRNIFWIRFLSKHAINDERINAFLYDTYQILSRHPEYHLLGNHLLENAFSLFFGACYFRDTAMYRKAYTLLKSELKEQVLCDGGHFELSPMYHQILLYRLLDCINAAKSNDWVKDDLSDFMGEKASAMLSWLRAMTFPSGDIPYLNDAAGNIAPSSAELFEYAERLHIARVDIPLSDSNYRVFKTGSYTCIFDIGGIAPKYQCGHAHADTFNVVLEIKGKPVFVDTGCSTYEKGAIRMIERGTSAHNTVMVNNANSSQVWSSHRVGKRAKVTILEDTPHKITAQHNGYGGKTHIRVFMHHDNVIEIIDEIKGTGGPSKNTALFHLDSGAGNVRMRDNTIAIGDITLVFEGSRDIYLNNYEQVVGFNEMLKAECICVDFIKKIKTVIVVD